MHQLKQVVNSDIIKIQEVLNKTINQYESEVQILRLELKEQSQRTPTLEDNDLKSMVESLDELLE